MSTIAVITGAKKGIGLETARLLGARGMTVVAGARDDAKGLEAERLLRAGGADVRYLPLDVTDAESLRQAAERVEEEYGLLDVLVNNARIPRAHRARLPSPTPPP